MAHATHTLEEREGVLLEQLKHLREKKNKKVAQEAYLKDPRVKRLLGMEAKIRRQLQLARLDKGRKEGSITNLQQKIEHRQHEIVQLGEKITDLAAKQADTKRSLEALHDEIVAKSESKTKAAA